MLHRVQKYKYTTPQPVQILNTKVNGEICNVVLVAFLGNHSVMFYYLVSSLQFNI